MMTGLLSLQMLFTKTSWSPTAKAMNGKSVAAEINNASEEIKNSCKPTKLVNVPYVNQNDIASGCESASATMLLQYYGYKISAKEFTDNYLIKKDWFLGSDEKPYGPDPYAAYTGNPYQSGGLHCGFGIFAPGTAKSIDKVLDAKRHQTKIITGMNLIDLIKNYIDKNIPVLIWATMDMKKSSYGYSWIINYVDENSPYKIGDIFTWVKGEHCLVLVGYDDNNYYFNDPYKNHGLITYEKELVNLRFLELGKQSVVILEKSLEVPLEEQL
jgi:uncharacterized protein YvpB